MVADKKYTPYFPPPAEGGEETSPEEINSELDKYWFNKTVRPWNEKGNHNLDNKLLIQFPNYRAFEEAVFDDKVISKKAKLFISFYDLDDNFAENIKEKVRVVINGKGNRCQYK